MIDVSFNGIPIVRSCEEADKEMDKAGNCVLRNLNRQSRILYQYSNSEYTAQCVHRSDLKTQHIGLDKFQRLGTFGLAWSLRVAQPTQTAAVVKGIAKSFH